MTEPVRSDTSGSTPLSITATTTPRPSVTCQAVGALTASRTHICALRTSSALAGLATATAALAPMASAAQQAAAETRAWRAAPLTIPASASRRASASWPQHPGAPGHRGAGGSAPSLAPTSFPIPSSTLSISPFV